MGDGSRAECGLIFRVEGRDKEYIKEGQRGATKGISIAYKESSRKRRGGSKTESVRMRNLWG